MDNESAKFINDLFNKIQSCRVDVAIMNGQRKFKDIVDDDIVKSAEALAREIQFLKRKGESNEED